MRTEGIALIKLWPGVIAGLLFLLVAALGMSGMLRTGRIRAGWRNALERMAGSKRILPWYQRTERWLSKNGAAFHFGGWMDPLRFLLLRIGLGALGIIILSGISLFYGVLGGGALFALPVILVYAMNKGDNQKMLPEMKHIYHSLEIQTRAGVYVTDALADIYGSVQEKRLKQALLELAGDIVLRSDLGEALETLQGKFDNRYLDSLCIIILQAIESGQSVDLLADLSEQIKDMEAAVMARKKEALDRSVTFYQLGILVAIMGIVLYACVTQMFTAAAGF